MSCGCLRHFNLTLKSEVLTFPIHFQKLLHSQPFTSYLVVTQFFSFLVLNNLCQPLTPPFLSKASSSISQFCQLYLKNKYRILSLLTNPAGAALISATCSRFSYWNRLPTDLPLSPLPLESSHNTTIIVILLKCKSWHVIPPVSSCFRVKDKYSIVTHLNARMYMSWSHYLSNLPSFYSPLSSATIAFFVAAGGGPQQTHILFRDFVLEFSSNWDALLQYPQIVFSSGLYSKATFSVRHHSDLNCCCILSISDSLLHFY